MDIIFYQKPKISNDSSYQIDFLNNNDVYNPYSKINKYSFVRLKMINQQIIKFLIEDFINIDIGKNKLQNVYFNRNFEKILLDVIYETMIEKSIDFFNHFFFKMSINEKNIKCILLGECFLPIICGRLLKEKLAMQIIVCRFYDCRKAKKQCILPNKPLFYDTCR